MIKLRILRWGDYLGGSNVMTSIFVRGRQEGQRRSDGEAQVRERDLKVLHCWVQAGGWGHEPRNAGDL